MKTGRHASLRASLCQKTPCSTSLHHVSPTHREILSQTSRGVAGISTRAVECRHAQLRRHLFSTGVQTHVRELAELSAVLLLDRASKCRFFRSGAPTTLSTMGLPLVHAPTATSNGRHILGTCMCGNGRWRFMPTACKGATTQT